MPGSWHRLFCFGRDGDARTDITVQAEDICTQASASSSENRPLLLLPDPVRDSSAGSRGLLLAAATRSWHFASTGRAQAGEGDVNQRDARFSALLAQELNCLVTGKQVTGLWLLSPRACKGQSSDEVMR